MLHTIETDPDRHNKAVSGFSAHLPHLEPFVRFHLGASRDVYPALLHSLGSVDAVFLDGAQDPDQAMKEFEMFEPHLSAGSILMMHDWDNEKMTLVRQRVERDKRWRIEKVLGHPQSVGFAVAVRLPDQP